MKPKIEELKDLQEFFESRMVKSKDGTFPTVQFTINSLLIFLAEVLADYETRLEGISQSLEKVITDHNIGIGKLKQRVLAIENIKPEYYKQIFGHSHAKEIRKIKKALRNESAEIHDACCRCQKCEVKFRESQKPAPEKPETIGWKRVTPESETQDAVREWANKTINPPFPAPEPIDVQVAKAMRFTVANIDDKWRMFEKKEPNFLTDIPPYSTDLAAAMGALEEYCKEHNIVCMAESCSSGEWWFKMHNSVSQVKECNYSHAWTLPLAICHAICKHAEGGK
jgi:hypothetical protein